jgi:hypothetical protein
MAAIQGGNQSPIITQKYLNTSTYAGDPAPGVLVSTAQVSGSIVQPYTGMVGGILTLGEGLANTYSDKTNGQQLYAGDYQYVQFYASSTATAVQGQIVFWQNLLNGNYIVTPDEATSDSGEIAGIALGATGKGNYWFIQTRGVANVKFKATLTNGSPAINDLIAIDTTTPSNLADDPTQTTPLTYALSKAILGTAWGTVPAGGAISPVFLTGTKYYPGA